MLTIYLDRIEVEDKSTVVCYLALQYLPIDGLFVHESLNP